MDSTTILNAFVLTKVTNRNLKSKFSYEFIVIMGCFVCLCYFYAVFLNWLCTRVKLAGSLQWLFVDALVLGCFVCYYFCSLLPLLRISFCYCVKWHVCLSLWVWLCSNALGCDGGKLGWEKIIKRGC